MQNFQDLQQRTSKAINQRGTLEHNLLAFMAGFEENELIVKVKAYIEAVNCEIDVRNELLEEVLKTLKINV